MNTPHSETTKLSNNENAYKLGGFVGSVVEEICNHLTLDDEVATLPDSIDQVEKDRLEWVRSRSNTYESGSRAIDRKWRRY
jgi:hypothetical protein